MRQGVALLFTLGVIALVSVLIMQNYEAIERYLDRSKTAQNKQLYTLQVKNIQEQIIKLLDKNSEELEEFLPVAFITLPLKEHSVYIRYIKFYDRYLNLNTLDHNDISNYRFLDYLKNSKKKEQKYSNSKQVSDTIMDYLLTHEDEQILELKDSFTFFDVGEKTLECQFELIADSQKINFYFIYDVTDSEVKDFELWY